MVEEQPAVNWVGGPPSPRELAVLERVAKGWTNDEIGQQLRIREVTVKAHVHSLMRKFDVANRAELAAKAVALGSVKGATRGGAPEEQP